MKYIVLAPLVEHCTGNSVIWRACAASDNLNKAHYCCFVESYIFQKQLKLRTRWDDSLMTDDFNNKASDDCGVAEHSSIQRQQINKTAMEWLKLTQWEGDSSSDQQHCLATKPQQKLRLFWREWLIECPEQWLSEWVSERMSEQVNMTVNSQWEIEWNRAGKSRWQTLTRSMWYRVYRWQ